MWILALVVLDSSQGKLIAWVIFIGYCLGFQFEVIDY